MIQSLDTDKAASELARRSLRTMSDQHLAWLRHLHPANLWMLCSRFETTAPVLLLARQYEMARRRAFPSAG